MKKSSLKNKKQIRRKRSTKPRLIIALALLTIMVASLLPNIFSNLFSNKTEAASNDIYDIVLFWGQSNMVGSANGGQEKRQGTTATSRQVFSEKSGIDLDIVEKIQSRYIVDVDVPEGCAYEYVYDADSYVNNNVYYPYSSWNQLRQNMNGYHGLQWTDAHLKPVGFDCVYGETLKAVNNGSMMMY